MSWRPVSGLAAMLCVCVGIEGYSASLAANPASEAAAVPAPKPATISPKPQAPIAKQKDGTLLIAGRALRCGGNRHVLDRGLPNLGLAAPGVLVFNPRALDRWPDTVRLFVYHHECGHHHVGGNELGADCWAVKQGVRDGWLTRERLVEVCRSFGNAPATLTHPSGARRCASLDRCFATATAALAREKARATAAAAPAATASPAPKLIQGPSLKRNGMLPSVDERR